MNNPHLDITQDKWNDQFISKIYKFNENLRFESNLNIILES